MLQNASKPEIKAAVELLFKVEVESGGEHQSKGQDQALWQDHRPSRQRRKAIVTEGRSSLNLSGEAA